MKLATKTMLGGLAVAALAAAGLAQSQPAERSAESHRGHAMSAQQGERMEQHRKAMQTRGSHSEGCMSGHAAGGPQRQRHEGEHEHDAKPSS